MSNDPRYLLINCGLWVDGISQIGQAKSITIPEVKVKMGKILNAGMVMEFETPMGVVEAMDFEFKSTAFEPAMLRLMGVTPGTLKQIMATATLVDSDGVYHDAVCTMRGSLKNIKLDAWEVGDKVKEQDYKYAVRYCKLTIDGAEEWEFDPFRIKVGGTDVTAAISRGILAR